MKWMLVILAGLAVTMFACDTDDESDGPISPQATSQIPTPSASPTSVAGSLEATIDLIRPLVASAIGAGQNTVRDIDVDGRNVTITLAGEQSLGDSTDFNQACNKVTDVIGFLDAQVVIKSSSGTQLASCS